MKRCGKCGEDKPLEDFNRDKRSPDGSAYNCRACTRAYAREYYNRNLAESRAKKFDYLCSLDQEQRRADGRERMKAWREANPERAAEAAKRDREKLRENHPDYQREWYQANIEKRQEQAREQMRAFRRDNPDRARAIRKRYREKHLDAIRRRGRETTYARRAKQPYSRELAQFMAELAQQPCAYCGATEDITIDHIVPLARDGKHEASNLNACCRPCNSSKCDRLLSEWKGRL